MRLQSLGGLCAAAALSLLAPMPAFADPRLNVQDTKAAALKWELSYLALSAVDAVQTMECLDRGICKEGNPLFGKHPSKKALIIGKVGFGMLHFAVFSYANERNPKTALRLAQITCAAQGSVVLLNARFTFK